MNGAHDLGGMEGFGPVVPEPVHIPFHSTWERRVLANTLACMAMGVWNIDAMRASREKLPPAEYLTSSYFEIWFKGLVSRLVAEGLVSRAEVESGISQGPGRPVPSVLTAERVLPALAAGAQYTREPDRPARFAAGAPVRTRQMNPSHHTRLPRYARGKAGVIEAVRGFFVFADANAQGLGPQPQWLYTVRFDGRELWGSESDPTLSVTIEAWESYLEPPI
ncbi:nitrile hydratase subunit beta [Xanthobacter dioxanivorans]|uniref:Nitrile hydratase subunit beta n=1 Tax=Xanthobacter dioxanivorans TaxID=2528964 RepID=A0A974SJA6_9HYPH|nr:nitrile hydratase subunit beta [Xanthobacter dioxanivorans]QRG07044.1 nitrile hydratase subunit beta [Xanthobacter dioxanivorans]